jgi:conjugal transfer pilus assembly protein TraF
MLFSKKIIFLAAFSLVSNASFAESFAFEEFKQKEEGWWWKKDTKEKAVKPPPEPIVAPKPVEEKKPEEPPKEDKKPFSVKWLNENMPKLLEAAIDDPSNENLAAYFYAQRVALDKSQTFAEKSRSLIAQDPLLDENSRVPMDTFARIDNMRGSSEAKTNALNRLSTVGGLWMFYRSDCKYCEPMAEGTMFFGNTHKFLTTFISLDNKPLKNVKEWIKDEGQAKLLNVKIAPTVVFVVPPNNYYVVSQGAMSGPELGNRILLAAETNGLLSQDEIKSIYPERRGVLGTEDVKDGATTEPKELVKRIRERLNKSYEQTP